MQLFVLDDQYRITSRFDPPRNGLVHVSANSSRLPAGVERAVRAATLVWRNGYSPAIACHADDPDVVICVSRLSGPRFSGLAIRIEHAAQMYPIG